MIQNNYVKQKAQNAKTAKKNVFLYGFIYNYLINISTLFLKGLIRR